MNLKRDTSHNYNKCIFTIAAQRVNIIIIIMIIITIMHCAQVIDGFPNSLTSTIYDPFSTTSFPWRMYIAMNTNAVQFGWYGTWLYGSISHGAFEHSYEHMSVKKKNIFVNLELIRNSPFSSSGYKLLIYVNRDVLDFVQNRMPQRNVVFCDQTHE